MDNLHPSLSQALPLRDYDAEQVLQAPFRAAALGIATFYKKAAENGRKAYSLGYSSALQDVLEYLQAGLDYGTDESEAQHSERRMAMTIERVMDYIQRRQEALRAEEPGEDEGVQPSSAPQQQVQSSASASSTSSNSTVHPRQPPPVPPAVERAPSTESEPAPPSSEPAPSHSSSTRRRVSPRRATPVAFDSAPPSETPPARPLEQLPNSFGTPPSTLNLMAHPINLDFSSFVSPLPQFAHPGSGGSATSRRHRGGSGPEARKGKTKERGVALERERSHGACAGSVGAPVMQLDPMELFPTGYAHYAAVPSAPCGSEEAPGGRVLSSIGNKRRFPVDQPGGHLDPVGLPPTQRLVRRSLAKNVSSTTVDEVVRSDVVARELGAKSGEDVVMVLGDETGERPSKRVLRKQYQP